MHLRLSRGKVCRARKKLGLASVCLGLVTGCTIFAPIQTPQADRRFALKNESTPGKNIPCKPINPEHLGECKPLEEDIDAFHGGLGRALWETDVRRRQLLSQAADHTNLNSTYNALLWPLGAYVIERKIRQPDWRTLDVAAVAAASFGLLGSGIPDRDQLYVRTAARMACSITMFDADLYLKTDIKPARFDAPVHKSDWRPRDPGDPAWLRHTLSDATLLERLEELSLALQNFTGQRDAVMVGLKLEKPKVAPSGTTPADKARLAAKNLNGGSKAQKDPSKNFMFETDTLAAKAQSQLGAALKLKQQLDDAGNRLRRQRIAIESALTQGLNERTTLQAPGTVATQIAQAFEAGMASERKFVDRVKQEAGTARNEDWLPTQAELADLEDNSRKRVVTFWVVDRVRLKQAMASLAEWTAHHDERLRLAKADASSMGCSDGDLSEFTRSLSKAAEGSGASTPTQPASAASK